MVAGNGEWKWNELEQLLPPYVLLHLAAIKCPLPSFGNDNVAWVMTNSGKFTLKSAYGVCAGHAAGLQQLASAAESCPIGPHCDRRVVLDLLVSTACGLVEIKYG
ncbi:hypothetical protein V6N13_067087 [Hibiscus sabdariffa]